MRAAVYYNNKDVRVEEVPVPETGRGELLVKVLASGICGSDVMEWYRLKKAPLVLGHEATGEIAEVGEGVDDYEKGDRVFVSHHVPCGECRYCLAGHETACETLHTTNYHPGGMAQFIGVPEINVEKGVFLLPEGMSFDEGTLIEPLACVVRGQRLAGGTEGKRVLVIGSGVSGLLHVRLAKAVGAEKITAVDISPYRLDAAKRFGADETIAAGKGATGKADLTIVCTGALDAAKNALECADRGGTILFFAVPEPGRTLPVDMSMLWRNEVAITTSYGAAPKDIGEAIDLIRSDRVKVNDMITHRLPMEEAGRGFRLVAEAGESLKVVIEPWR